MSVSRITPREAQQRLDSESNVRYVDVRSVREFEQGHPPGAVNVPLLDFPATGGPMQPNPRFMEVMSASFDKGTPIITGCAMGGRSLRAAEMLTQAGFENVVDMKGGYGGRRAPTGEVLEEGWSTAGLPTSTDAGDGESYQSLLDRIG